MESGRTSPGVCLYIPFWLNLYCVSICRLMLLGQTLHSILVKSILRQNAIRNNLFFLYIPFWLNLYMRQIILLQTLCKLYIPFWLNLYKLLKNAMKRHFPLHSILVKSIQDATEFIRPIVVTLHSILVKSIRRRQVLKP